METAILINEGFSDSYIKSKTTIGVLRYGKYEVIAVIDSNKAGYTVKQVFNINKDIPIVKDIDDALKLHDKINYAIIGFSDLGLGFSEKTLNLVKESLENGITVINGLHRTLSDDLELTKIAKENYAEIYDVRIPQNQKFYSRYNPHREGSLTLLTVGSDNSVGKMTTTFELAIEAKKRLHNAAIAATGQTGIILEGSGVPVDNTIADYTIGMVGNYVSKLTDNYDWVFVEGQGTVVRGNIALGLIQGADPDGFILCHDEGRKWMKDYNMWKIPELSELKRIYEQIGAWIRNDNPAKVIAISLNTNNIKEDEEAISQIKKYEDELGIPVTDPVRFGSKKIVDYLELIYSK